MSKIGRVGEWLRRARRSIGRREIAARLLGTAADESEATSPGLVLIQIDGLPRTQLERAVERGRMPFLRRLRDREGHRLGTFYSGLPSTTPAVQAEIFYGVSTAVPAFAFRSREKGEIVRMLDPDDGARREELVAEAGGPPLLAGGSAYCDVYRAGAAEPHFCVGALTYRSLWRRVRPWLWPALAVLYLPTAVRALARALVEVFLGLADAMRGIAQGQPAKSEFQFIKMRVLVGVLLREWAVAGARLDATRGMRVIHVNLLAYDERSHRRGPDSEFAHRSLRGIDRAIRRIWRAAHASSRREYELWVYSDHGQERTIPYPSKYGRGIEEVVTEVATRTLSPGEPGKPRVVVAALGPIGHVYPDPPVDAAECGRLAEALLRDAGVPVAYVVEGGDVRFSTASGRKGRLPENAADLLGADHPRLKEVSEDLVALCRHPEAGQVVIGGWVTGEPPLSFVGENGAHAGPGPEETGGFTLLPGDVPVPTDRCVRPREFREAVLARLAAEPGKWSAVCRKRSAGRNTFRLVTYNVHGCVGTGGRLSTRRIARVLAACDPDVIALQELDVGRRRSSGRDQAQDIARELGMTCRFHPSLRVAEEEYGNAVLSRYPMNLVHAGPLPERVRRPAEPRGAVWVEVDLGGRTLQVIVTHLGLAGDERALQVEALLGPEWLGSPQCRGPAVLCGDLNAGPRSRQYAALAARLRDAAFQAGSRPRPTFLSRWPVVRIDHVFVTDEIEVVAAEVPRTGLAALASDHLPLVVDLRVR